MKVKRQYLEDIVAEELQQILNEENITEVEIFNKFRNWLRGGNKLPLVGREASLPTDQSFSRWKTQADQMPNLTRTRRMDIPITNPPTSSPVPQIDQDDEERNKKVSTISSEPATVSQTAKAAPEKRQTKKIEPTKDLRTIPTNVFGPSPQLDAHIRDLLPYYSKKLPNISPENITKVLSSLIRQRKILAEAREQDNLPIKGISYQEADPSFVNQFELIKTTKIFRHLINLIKKETNVSETEIVNILKLTFDDKKLSTDQREIDSIAKRQRAIQRITQNKPKQDSTDITTSVTSGTPQQYSFSSDVPQTPSEYTVGEPVDRNQQKISSPINAAEININTTDEEISNILKPNEGEVGLSAVDTNMLIGKNFNQKRIEKIDNLMRQKRESKKHNSYNKLYENWKKFTKG